MEIAKNIRTEDGRIFSGNSNLSYMINNKYREELLENVEDGIKEVVRKLIDVGYETLSSCQGHPIKTEEFEHLFRYVKFCIERTQASRIVKNVKDINMKYKTNITVYITDNENNGEEYLKEVTNKEYKEPLTAEICFGRYDECGYNYETFLEHFDEFTWI